MPIGCVWHAHCSNAGFDTFIIRKHGGAGMSQFEKSTDLCDVVSILFAVSNKLRLRQRAGLFCTSGKSSKRQQIGYQKNVKAESEWRTVWRGVSFWRQFERTVSSSSSGLMTIGHKAGHYCYFRVLRSANNDTGRKKREGEKKKKFWNLLFWNNVVQLGVFTESFFFLAFVLVQKVYFRPPWW